MRRDGCSFKPEIYVMNADGTARRRLTANGVDDRRPAWSPDGSRIVFASDRNYPSGEGNELYSITPDGGCLTWLTNGSPASDFPAWEPGAGLSSDPGACGPVARPPLVTTDISSALKFKRAPVYWVGPIAPDGLLLSFVDPGHDGVRLDYGDCGEYEPARCPGATFDVYSRPACGVAAIDTFYSGKLSIQRGALVNRTGGFTDVWTGTTNGSISTGGRARVSALLAQLRPVGDATPPAALPPAALPRAIWRDARPRTRRKLRALGVKRLRC